MPTDDAVRRLPFCKPTPLMAVAPLGSTALHNVGLPLPQMPAVQNSSVVHASLSSQPRPSATLTCLQAPAQMSSVHGLPSSQDAAL